MRSRRRAAPRNSLILMKSRCLRRFLPSTSKMMEQACKRLQALAFK
jgi:hypothetical protein